MPSTRKYRTSYLYISQSPSDSTHKCFLQVLLFWINHSTCNLCPLRHPLSIQRPQKNYRMRASASVVSFATVESRSTRAGTRRLQSVHHLCQTLNDAKLPCNDKVHMVDIENVDILLSARSVLYPCYLPCTKEAVQTLADKTSAATTHGIVVGW